jgi:T-complex protein 1 subunit zeta
MSLKTVNPNADVIGTQHALMMNIQAARGLQNVLKTNLGPKGTLKMLVGGAGDVKLTKDGKVLLDEMQIQHPTAAIIARTATAQDDITGDGTTSNVLFTGELLHQAARYLEEGLHARVVVEGIEKARDETLKFLDEFQIKKDEKELDRELMVQVARTSLRTKVHSELADHLTEIVVDAVRAVHVPGEPIDLHMVEIMHMLHQSAFDTKFINGLVLDHGARHPNMAKRTENAFIFVCNVSLEYEKSEVNAGFYYKDAEERAKLVSAERKYTDDKVSRCCPSLPLHR